MRIVIDSNVIIAAFAAKGLCHSLLESCIGNQEIILCEDIITETFEKLKKKIKLTDKVVHQIIEFLKEYSIIIKPQVIDPDSCRDKNDLMVLGTAISGNVDYIISGDKDLLEISVFRNIPIINPRTFWQILRDNNKIQ